MRKWWESLSFSCTFNLKLKLGRLEIVIRLKPAAAAEPERQATGEA